MEHMDAQPITSWDKYNIMQGSKSMCQAEVCVKSKPAVARLVGAIREFGHETRVVLCTRFAYCRIKTYEGAGAKAGKSMGPAAM